LTVTASSPDGQISAEVSWEGQVLSLTFRPGAYRRYTESILSHQLTQLATLLWTRQRRYYREMVDAAFDNPIHDDAVDLGPGRREYRQRLGQIVAEGASADRSIRVRTEGMRRWEFTIAEQTLRRLLEREFVGQLSGAVANLLASHQVQVILLKDEIYGLGLPDRLQPPDTAAHQGGN
jgi:hypothetical protein